jgi:hypothetical protein
MSMPRGTSIAPHAAAIGLCASQSLAGYIAAICAKHFGSMPAAEAPYLAENVSAMTKMMVDTGTTLR